MIRSLVAVIALVGGCAVSGGAPSRSMPMAQGGSVTDYDRGADTRASGSPAGGRNTIGPSDDTPVLPRHAHAELRVRSFVAGPWQPQRSARALQQALAARGYYQGPLNGESDAALVDATRRYQADQGLPITGRADSLTSQALGVVVTPPPPGAM